MAGGAGQAAPEAREVNGIAFHGQALTGVTGKDLAGLIDEHKARIGIGRGAADRRYRRQGGGRGRGVTGGI